MHCHFAYATTASNVFAVPLLNRSHRSFALQLATLLTDVSGDGFMEKAFRLSLQGVKPAAFGTTKTVSRELAWTTLDVAAWAGKAEAKHQKR